MTRKNGLLTCLAMLLFAPVVRGQLSTVVVVDFERAVVESREGKKSSDKFNGAVQAKQGEIEKKTKELDDQQKKLQNGARTLSEAAKADLQKDIDRRTTDLKRLNEDAQKELGVLRDELLRPIAERATAILNAMATEKGYTLVVDLSDQDSTVIWFNKNNDVTEELVKRIDAATAPETTKTEPAKPASPPPASATPPANRSNTPATTPAPRPATPPPSTPPKP